jgi:hypothetical protein
MSFTAEQQAEIDAEVARRMGEYAATQAGQIEVMQQQHANAMELQTSNQSAQAAIQSAQAAASLEIQSKQAKLSAVQLAQSTLIANRNNLPVDSREISAADITAYADLLVSYVNS